MFETLTESKKFSCDENDFFLILNNHFKTEEEEGNRPIHLLKLLGFVI